jgi:hypothetical protein
MLFLHTTSKYLNMQLQSSQAQAKYKEFMFFYVCPSSALGGARPRLGPRAARRSPHAMSMSMSRELERAAVRRRG